MSETQCLGCGQQLGTPFLDLGCSPLANSYVPPERAGQPEQCFPLRVAYCEHCHLVQLLDRVPPEELFTEYLYFSSYSDTVLRHAAQMARQLIQRFGLGPSHRVVEVASNDGYLLQYFQRAGIPVLGVEPAKNIAAYALQRGIPTLNAFFGPPLVPQLLAEFGAADLLIGNNVLAHVPEINGFLSAVRDCLKPDGWAVFEFPYAVDLVEHCEFDTIYHEHVFYYSLSAVERLARRAGLTLADVSHQSLHGGSLRIFLSRAPGVQPTEAVSYMLEREQRLGVTSAGYYQRFAAAVERVRSQLRSLLMELKAKGHRLAAYGAPAKGNTLLNVCQIDNRTIEFTVDRNPFKQGKLLPGSRIPVLAPEALLESMPDFVLILPWNIAQEIIEQQKEYLRRGGQFILPIPTPRIIRGPGQSTAALRTGVGESEDA